jgi:hypothetical protein
MADATKPPPPLGTLSGKLNMAANSPIANESGHLRMTLAWDSTKGPAYMDVPITPEFPASFQLALNGPPPADAIVTADSGHAAMMPPWPQPGQTAAQGHLIAYYDGNGNGQLDQVPLDATSAPDRIVATSNPGLSDTNETFYVVYGTGGYWASAWGEIYAGGAAIHDGYALVVYRGNALTFAPIDTPVTLATIHDPTDNLVLCNPTDVDDERLWLGNISGDRQGFTFPLAMNLAPVAPAGISYPPATHPLLDCSPGGTQFCMLGCPAGQDKGGIVNLANATSYDVCQTYVTTWGISTPAPPAPCSTGITDMQGHAVPECFTMPAATPAGWPCTYTPGIDGTPPATDDPNAGAPAFDAGTGD